MNNHKKNWGVLRAALVVIILLSARIASGDIVTVLFTGFNPGPMAGQGMVRLLEDTLQPNFAADFPNQTFAGQVFEYGQQTNAFNYINGFSDIDALFLVGHSFGGNTLIRLAAEELMANGISVDATFQIDSVDNFLDPGLPDNVLPGNVDVGYNFFQIATFPDIISGEDNVLGAININAETFFGEPLTHTTIDNYVPLHEFIYGNMRLIAIPEPGSLALLGLGIAIVATRRRSRS